MTMKSLISLLLAAAVIVAGLFSAPEATRAQTPADGQSATPTATVPGTDAGPPASASPEPVGASGSMTLDADEDPLADDPAADELVVREERDDEAALGSLPSAGRNVAYIYNRADGSRRFRARVRLVKVMGDRVAPVNAAVARTSCTDCEAYAVALEIVLFRNDASVIVPQNYAYAVTENCVHCVSVARAMQYAYGVEDPNMVPNEVRHLLHDMEKELREIGGDRSITIGEANERVNVVVRRFVHFNAYLKDELRQAHDESTPGAAAPAVPAAAPASQPAPAPEPVPAPAPSPVTP
jgi:hypothetical protein